MKTTKKIQLPSRIVLYISTSLRDYAASQVKDIRNLIVSGMAQRDEVVNNAN